MQSNLAALKSRRICGCKEEMEVKDTKVELKNQFEVLGNMCGVENEQEEEWEEIDVTVDSGAIDNVMEKEKGMKFGIKQTEKSKIIL